MSPHEFIKASIDKELAKLGYDPAVCLLAADDAVDYYKRTAHFKKGALADCIAHAKRRAKEHAKLSPSRRAHA